MCDIECIVFVCAAVYMYSVCHSVMATWTMAVLQFTLVNGQVGAHVAVTVGKDYK